MTPYDDRGWRATFYPSGMEHSPTSAIGTGWERTPWRAVQRAAWDALRRAAEWYAAVLFVVSAENSSREADTTRDGGTSSASAMTTVPGPYSLPYLVCRRPRQLEPFVSFRYSSRLATGSATKLASGR